MAETHVSEKSLALIGNASGQDAEGAINCSEAFSTRRLEGRRSQWWVLLWICGQDSAPVNEGRVLKWESGDVANQEECSRIKLSPVKTRDRWRTDQCGLVSGNRDFAGASETSRTFQCQPGVVCH